MDKLLQAERALIGWQDWAVNLHTRPEILKPLSGGRSNQSFLLDSHGKRMVLRLNGSESLLPASRRNSEYKVWQAASEQGIAPRLLHVDVQHGFLVSRFIENTLPQKPPCKNRYAEMALDLLDRCHRLDVDAKSINYSDHIERYWKRIEAKARRPDKHLAQQRTAMQDLLKSLLESDTATGLCHHDPIVANFVGDTNRVYLIDWEYAANGLQIMDYAALAVEWKLADSLITLRTGIGADRLSMAKSLYRYLCRLWALLQI